MDATLKLTVLLSVVLNCNGVSIREQLAHIARRFGGREDSVILGSPSFPNHLPEAEPILPGHTLLRPAIGMLKSAVKFPHKELENGAGVYGNIRNLGLRYGNRNQRVLYSGFRRMPNDDDRVETNSDSSHDEGPGLREKVRNPNRQRDYIKRYVRIFPAGEKGNSEYASKKQNLYANLLPGGNRNWNQNNQPYDEDDLYTRSRSKREIKRSLNTRLHSSAQTLQFASMLLKKLQENKPRRKQQNIVVLQPIGSSSVLDESDSLEEITEPKSYFGEKKTMGFTNGLLRKLSRQRRQQNIVLLPEDNGLPVYGGGTDQSVEDTESEVTERPTNWFYKDKNAYNHIKINPDAPEQEDYLPKDYSEENNDIRNWWYYHQYDFIPFEVDDKI